MSYYAYRMVGRREKTRELEYKRTISNDLVSILGEDWSKDDFVSDPDRFSALNRETFGLSCKISNALLFRFFRKFVKRISKGKIFGSLEALSALGPVSLGIAPYLSDNKNGLAGQNVIFTGSLLGEELSRAYSSSDVFVFPSTIDTVGNVVLEAMASGVPVVVRLTLAPEFVLKRPRFTIWSLPMVPSKLFINGQVAPNASRSVVLGSNATEVVAVA